MHSAWVGYVLGALCLTNFAVRVLSLQCYELSCNGTNCLGTEVSRNPLLIKKCSRVIYKGCYTVTTTFNGFTLTTTGCVDRMFDCSEGACSGTFIKTKVSCCNEDLCNEGEVASAGFIPVCLTTTCVILCFLFHTLLAEV